MFLIENTSVAFLDKSDFQDAEKSTELRALKPEIEIQTLPISILIYEGKIVKNRFGEVCHA
ncbi:hypothetical protein [uncultured Serratia sp.]|uniref:hypothetical protein n=1 Tax=uncultured Serratia sp. TaxID=239175 RepID=UPI00258E8807|nr:hypothetical protein [uncultured Serratia sp.]